MSEQHFENSAARQHDTLNMNKAMHQQNIRLCHNNNFYKQLS